MDLDVILQYSFSLAITIFVALVVTLVFYLSEKKLKPHPDYVSVYNFYMNNVTN